MSQDSFINMTNEPTASVPLLERIQQRQARYYTYAINCIDMFLDSNDIKPLSYLVGSLYRMDRGHVALGDDYADLSDACKHSDVVKLRQLKHRFQTNLDGMLVMTATPSVSAGPRDSMDSTTPPVAEA